MKIAYLAFVFQVEAIYVVGCNSSGRNGDVAFNEPLKYVGTPGWPGPMEGPYECAWDLSVDPWEAKEYPMLKIVIIDLKTDCSKRSRVWITEGGQKRGTYTCGRQPIQEYIARSGKVTVGVDVAMNSQVLVSFQAVKGPTPKGRQSTPPNLGLNQLRNSILGSKVDVTGLYQEQGREIPSADQNYLERNFPSIGLTDPTGFQPGLQPGSLGRQPLPLGRQPFPGNSLFQPGLGPRPLRPRRLLTTKRPLNVIIPTLEPKVTESTQSRKGKLEEKLAQEAAANQKSMNFVIFLGSAIVLSGVAVLVMNVFTRHQNDQMERTESARREKDLVERCT